MASKCNYFSHFEDPHYQTRIFQKDIFQKDIFTTPNFLFSNDFKHKKWKLHEGLKLLTLLQAKWQAVKHAIY